MPRAVELEDDIMYRHCEVFLDFYELGMPLGLTEQERDMLPDLIGKVESYIRMDCLMYNIKFFLLMSLVSHSSPSNHFTQFLL